MVVRPLELIINELIQEIQAVLPNVSTLPGSALREAFVNPPAAQISFLSEAIENVRVAQTVSEATGAALDRLASNYGLVRETGRTAVGELVLVFSTSINNQDIVVSDGSTVATNERINTVEFSVIGTFTFRPIDRDFFSAEAVRLESQLRTAGITDAEYVATVPIQAIRSGSLGNVGAQAIRRANVAGIRAVVNLSPTVGGTDIESDASLRRRITLALASSSRGTEEGLTSIALANPNITDAVVIRPGDPLMVRDGSVFDEEGNLVKAGTGRSVDLYVKGSQFITNTETFVFTDNSEGESVSIENSLVLGYDEVSTTNQFAKQPVTQILDLTGSVSGANFRQAIEVADDEGNVILEGNYTLLKDIEQEDVPLIIVKDNQTGETKVAAFISDLNTRYSVIETLTPSNKGNSALGLDSVFFLTNVASIDQEVVTRGPEFNGSDSLALTNVAQIGEIDEDIILTKESVLITEQSLETDAFIIYTKHKPVVEVTDVRHARLGFNYDFELLDAAEGKIQLVGRFVPQEDDVIQVSYTWRQNHIQNVEYFLQGDTVKWSREPFERSQVAGLTLLEPTTLTSSLDLQVQPLVPTYLGIQTNQLTARARYNMTVNGDKARIVTDEDVTYDSAPSFDTDDFLFNVSIPQSATASGSRLGRVIAVHNLSKGYEYSIENMTLNTNVFDPSVRVEQALADNEFLLDAILNTRNLEVGDKILLSRKSLLKHWTTTEDFTNNLNGQVSPTLDSITTNISNDEIAVQRQEDDADSPTSILSGSILESGILSGIVEIADEVIIEQGVVVVLQPNTVVRFRDAASLDSTEIVQELVELDNAITDVDINAATDIEENAYIFERPVSSTAPFFVILNDSGTDTLSIFYDRNVIRQVVTARDGGGLPTAFDYYIDDRLVPTDFLGGPTDNGLVAAIETSGIYLGYRRDNGDSTSTFVAASTVINGRTQYGIPLTETPRATGFTEDDFSFYQVSDVDATFTDIAYDSERNVFLVDGLATETDYTVEYFKSIVKRLALRVRGTLQTAADVDENNPVVFTSTADEPAPGDWEGIIFEPSSHTNAPGNPFNTSFLISCTVKNARIGVQNNVSDPLIDRCLIKNNLEGGYTAISSFFHVPGFTNDKFELRSNDFTTAGRSYAEERFTGGGEYGYGYGSTTSTRTLSLNIDDFLTTALGDVPSFTKVGVLSLPTEDTLEVINFQAKYVADLIAGTDFQVLVDGTPLVPGVDADFAIEYDRTRGGFLLSFFNTQLTLDFLTANLANPNIITLDYYAAYDNGAINNSIFTGNGNSAIDLNKASVVSIVNNTIHENGFYGVTVDNSYATLRNNLITEFDVAPIVQTHGGIVDATTNNMWSLPIISLEQTEVAEIDTLVLDVTTTDTILTVATASLYGRNTVLKIDDEFMQVQEVLGDRISVTRGFNNTTPTEHNADADILIQRTKAIFTVTGIPGNFCQIRETASDGTLLTGREPVTMLKIADSTFRASFSVDRSSTFYYRYQFKQDLAELQWILTNTRRLTTNQFGSAVNNFVNPNHEVAINVTPFGSIDTTNYSDNPLYGQADTEDFGIPNNSPSSADNDIYATPYDPSETRLRFLGQRPIVQTISLSTGTSSIALDFTPIVTTSLQTDIVIQLASNTSRTLTAGTYDDTTKTLTLSIPVSSSDVGTYQVLYNTPITLGTTISPFPLITTVVYQFNEQRVVDWTKLGWTEAGGSGNVRARFRVANSPAELNDTAYSSFADGTPFDLSFGTGVFPRGSVIELELTLETNDAGFATDGSPVFPRLQDFTLFLTPARDNVLYKVLDATFDTKTQKTVVTIEDDENEGLGIRSSTFTTIGSGDALSAIVRKASDDFTESTEFVIGEADAVVVGDTALSIKGNVILERAAPDVGDEVVADLIFVDLDDSEDIVFIENGTQVTQSLFYKVDNIATQVVIDKALSALATEVMSISALDQPAPGAQYLATYTFTAPLDGEALTVSYTYNDAVRAVAQNVETERVLTSDVLVRAAVEVAIRIEASVQIASGFSANAIAIDVANALGVFFDAQASFGGTILVDDVEATIANVTGVTSAGLNVLSRTPEAVVENITLTAREFPVLATNNPLLTISLASNPSQPLTTNSV